jgi:hypothetical protein
MYFNIISKQVLLNLLIAMMASTYEKALENSRIQRLQERYRLVRDASYICSSGEIKWGEREEGGRKNCSGGSLLTDFNISKFAVQRAHLRTPPTLTTHVFVDNVGYQARKVSTE